VNFFGHAFLAAERHADPDFVLGSMLPDLAGFAGEPSERWLRHAAGDGVRFHRATDSAFHRAPAFGSFCASHSRALQERGMRRGPALGAAHVGGELLLDGWLAVEWGEPALYRGALHAAPALLGVDASEELLAVCARLAAAPVPRAYADAAFVVARVVRALASRPRLALSAAEESLLRDELARAREETPRWAPRALAEVRAAL
jgi:hypothetical protein